VTTKTETPADDLGKVSAPAATLPPPAPKNKGGRPKGSKNKAKPTDPADAADAAENPKRSKNKVSFKDLPPDVLLKLSQRYVEGTSALAAKRNRKLNWPDGSPQIIAAVTGDYLETVDLELDPLWVMVIVLGGLTGWAVATSEPIEKAPPKPVQAERVEETKAA